MTQAIRDKIKELEELLASDMPENSVMFRVTFTGEGQSITSEYKTAEQLNVQGDSMRNLKGEFIN